MSKQHKWHKEIKAWADGAEIEIRIGKNWTNCVPVWYEENEYRIKPQPKEPQYLYVYGDDTGSAGIDLIKMNTRYGQPYKGKIKLEVDDE